MDGNSAGACRLVVLISGRGSNMRAIVAALQAQRLPAQVCAVVSNRADAPGLAWARAQGIATHVVANVEYPTREAFDSALGDVVQGCAPDYVLLAGFMRVLTDGFVQRFQGRLLNIHPSLLPLFPGLHTHRQALQAGVRWHGCTVHFVTPVLDHGPIVAQAMVPVLPNDTEAALAARLLPAEHGLYAQVAGWLARGQVRLRDDGVVEVRDAPARAFVLADPAHRLAAPQGADAGGLSASADAAQSLVPSPDAA